MEAKQTAKADIEKMLREGKTVQFQPQGYSMYPLFLPGRDAAIVQPVTDPAKLKRGDVVLYRREQSILVLHRIWKRDGSGFYLVGDNQKEIEGPLKAEQMKGILTGFIRKGKYCPVRNPAYRLYSTVWLRLRPVRSRIGKTIHKLKGFFQK